MGKSKNKSRSEVEFLRGQVRQLKAELKYYRRREHIETSIIDDVIEDAPIENINASQCPACSGLLISYDFTYAILRKCQCGFEERRRKT